MTVSLTPLAAWCPRCNAAPGQACANPSGRQVAAHLARRRESEATMTAALLATPEDWRSLRADVTLIAEQVVRLSRWARERGMA